MSDEAKVTSAGIRRSIEEQQAEIEDDREVMATLRKLGAKETPALGERMHNVANRLSKIIALREEIVLELRRASYVLEEA